MFQRRKIEELERKLQGLQEAHSKLAEAIERGFEKIAEKTAAAGPSADAAGIALSAVGQLLGNLSESLRASQESQQKLLDSLMTKASKTVARSIDGKALSEAGVKMRKDKAALRHAGLPEFVLDCEECLAILQKRPARHTTHVLAHEREKHAEQLRVFQNQLKLPLGDASLN